MFDGICETVVSPIAPEELDAMLETPVIGKTSDASMLVKVCLLPIVRVKFVPIGFGHQHEVQDIVLFGDFKLIQSSF